MAEKLDVFGWHSSYRISWSEDGDEGLILGPGLLQEFSDKPEMADTVCAVSAIRAMPDDARRLDGGVWLWESEAKAKKALKVARDAMKVHESKIHWPEWAKHALAEGWKPPKGWKPSPAPLPSIPNPESEK